MGVRNIFEYLYRGYKNPGKMLPAIHFYKDSLLIGVWFDRDTGTKLLEATVNLDDDQLKIELISQLTTSRSDYINDSRTVICERSIPPAWPRMPIPVQRTDLGLLRIYAVLKRLSISQYYCVNNFSINIFCFYIAPL